jgi:hypothetical protein
MEENQSVEQLASAHALGPLASLFPAVSPAEVRAVLALIPLEKKSRLATGEALLLSRLISPDTHLKTLQEAVRQGALA